MNYSLVFHNPKSSGFEWMFSNLGGSKIGMEQRRAPLETPFLCFKVSLS
jgi:hypothetical protein